MKKIPLTQGKYAIVDNEDYVWLLQWKWTLTKNGSQEYAARYERKCGKRKKIYIHHEVYCHSHKIPYHIWKVKNTEIDHLNGNALDNRICNLRKTTRSQNNLNRHNVTPHSSIYTGVCFSFSKSDRNHKKWKAYIGLKGKLYNLGRFYTEIEAFYARQGAERRVKNGLPLVE